MAILVDERSRILVQGATGATGRSFARRMAGSGTPLVAGVTPGRGGQELFGIPVFDSVREAVAATGATTSLVAVPALEVAAAVWEAAAAGIGLISVYTEHVPVQDAARMISLARSLGARVIGPNSAGVVSPGRANASDLDDANLAAGRVGIVSKSGTLTYEVIDGLQRRGLGESTVVCLGGDPIVGTGPAEVLRLFAADPETSAVVLLGEIGGEAEVEAARAWRELGSPKPLAAYVAGHAAPAGKRMGHAGAIVTGGRDTAEAKSAELERLGVRVARLVGDLPALVAG